MRIKSEGLVCLYNNSFVVAFPDFPIHSIFLSSPDANRLTGERLQITLRNDGKHI